MSPCDRPQDSIGWFLMRDVLDGAQMSDDDETIDDLLQQVGDDDTSLEEQAIQAVRMLSRPNPWPPRTIPDPIHDALDSRMADGGQHCTSWLRRARTCSTSAL